MGRRSRGQGYRGSRRRGYRGRRSRRRGCRREEEQEVELQEGRRSYRGGQEVEL